MMENPPHEGEPRPQPEADELPAVEQIAEDIGSCLAKLSELQIQSAEVQRAIQSQVGVCRANGARWEDVGRALKISKSVAHYRFGK